MAAHGIDVFDIEFWNGPAPEFAQPVIESHTRPGVWGTYQVNNGVKGQAFEVTLKHVVDSYVNANLLLAQWNTLVGIGPVQIKYNGINYLGTYGHLYSLDRILSRHAYATVGAIGPNYFYPFGGVAKMRCVLTPHPVVLQA